MSSTTIALTSDPWSNKVAVNLNWSIRGTTDCKNAVVMMKSDLENIYLTEKKYDLVSVGENISTNMDMLFLSSASPGDDYLQVFVSCDNTGCNNTGKFSDSQLLLFKITPLKCTTNENCSKAQYCKTDTQQCLELDCGGCDIITNHTCVSTCDDSNLCTVDFCSVNNTCEHNITENCCQTNTDCNDNLSCTSETCTNNKCFYQNITCEVSNSCEISLCVEPQGCKIYNKTDCDTNKKTPPTVQKTTALEKTDTFSPSIPKDKNLILVAILGLILIIKFTFLR
ncbi:MAG: hypothetical protein KAS12_00440 [Candidatus Aenigmarchaeota archaeon]|nr:hypothetical protein [Candidatus Aenigmarchaeota archaeon]